MRFIRIAIASLLLAIPSHLIALDSPVPGRAASMDLLMDGAISANMIDGGVILVGNHDGILYSTAKGRLCSRPEAPVLTERTMFDVASLTKVIATTPAVMKLLDQGRISLIAPLARWFPEFRGSGREEITILNLLTHTSGLGDFQLRPWQGMRAAISRAAAQKDRPRPGSSFEYADINFILLGELVRRVSGRPLDAYCRDELFAPLGLRDTMFNPPEHLSDGIAPTLGFSSGVVQDDNARRLGRVAGHAGLFSSAHDLGRFARMILNGGTLDGKRILSERVVAQMTVPYFCSDTRVIRGLGWDMTSPFSAPKGTCFSENSFGHTGYSGSSIWIDPQWNMFVVLLTNRLNYRDTAGFNQLRRDVSTAAAGFIAERDQGLPIPWDLATFTAVVPARAEMQVPPRGRYVAASLGEKRMTQPRESRKKGKKEGKKKSRKPGQNRRG